MNKREYFLNLWQSSLNTGSSLLYRTTDLDEFKDAIKTFITVHIPAKGLFKVTHYRDRVFVSYCDNLDVFNMWKTEQPKGKVDSVIFCKIDKLFDLL